MEIIRGIIPARAGFTGWTRDVGRMSCGSSPLARGLHPFLLGDTHEHRIIPARAGFTTP